MRYVRSVSRHPYKDIFGSLLRCYTAYYSGQVDEWRARMSAESSTRGRGSAASSGVGTSSASGVSVRLPRRIKEARKFLVRGSRIRLFYFELNDGLFV